MAGENANPFGVESIMETGGIGDVTLLQGLMETESATSNPDEIKEIKEEPKETPKKQEEVVEKSTEKDEKKSAQEVVSQFLGEEEEDEPEKVENPIGKKEEEEIPQEFNQYSALAKDLYKLGVFTTSEGEEEISPNSPEEFLEVFNNEKRKGASEMVDNFLGQFGEDYRNAFEAIFVKGVNPKEYFTTYNEIVDLASIDLSVEKNQESVMRQSLAEQGFEPDEVDTEIDKLKNYGDLEDTAKRHHKVLVKRQAQNLQQKEKEAELLKQQKEAVRAQYIQNVQAILQEKVKEKEFDGIPVNAKLATELQEFLLMDKWKTANGETLTDFDRTILELKRPENHAMKVKVALLLKILEKDPTLATIQRSAITKKSDQLFGELAKHKDSKAVPKASQNISSFFR